MKNKKQSMPAKQVTAPVSGRIVPLDEVPDAVFAERILGDGVAILPDAGRIVSPVDGVVSSVAETRHAYGFTADNGLEVLVHFGLETVELKGEGFQSHVKVGDRVHVGDLVAEVDLKLLGEKNINSITPVLVCNASSEEQLERMSGEAQEGKTTLFAVRTPQEKETEAKGSFDLLQKLGKVLMVVIAVMPAAGLMISIGKLLAMAGVTVCCRRYHGKHRLGNHHQPAYFVCGCHWRLLGTGAGRRCFCRSDCIYSHQLYYRCDFRGHQ